MQAVSECFMKGLGVDRDDNSASIYRIRASQKEQGTLVSKLAKTWALSRESPVYLYMFA